MASYNIPDEQKKNALAGLEDTRTSFSRQSETMFNVLGKKEKNELDFLYFMAGSFNEYELKDGKLFFHNAMARQRYIELAKSIEDTARETAAARKEWLNNVNTNIQKTEPVIRPWILAGEKIFVADAHRDNGKRFIVSADEKLTAFLELEHQTRIC